MTNTPVGREAQGLSAIENIGDDVRRKERQVDQLVNPAVCRGFRSGNLRQCPACFDLLKPEMRFGDVPDQSFVSTCPSITKDQLCLNTALPQLEARCNHQQRLVNLVGANCDHRSKLNGINCDAQRTGVQIDPRDKIERATDVLVSTKVLKAAVMRPYVFG